MNELSGDTRLKWKPDERHFLSPHKRYSWWYGGPLSLPPLAKIAFTIATLLVVVFFLFFANSLGSGLVLIPYAAAFTWGIWRRTRVQ